MPATVTDLATWQLERLTQRYLTYVAPMTTGQLRSDIEFFAAEQQRVNAAVAAAMEMLLWLCCESESLPEELREKVNDIDASRVSFEQICEDLAVLISEHSPATQLELFVAARMVVRRFTLIVDSFQ